jgi:hypothetical protein
MNRRKFIWVTGTGIVAATLPLLTSCQSSPWIGVLSMPSVLGQFCSEAELMAMGRSYIELVPDEAKISVLEDELLKVEDGSSFNPESEKSLRDFIVKKSEHDFVTEQTYIIKGWVMSQTEARQCGLFFLTHTNS